MYSLYFYYPVLLGLFVKPLHLNLPFWKTSSLAIKTKDTQKEKRGGH